MWRSNHSSLTYGLDSLSICQVVSDYLAHLREVPSVPFPAPHDVVVQFLVQIIQQGFSESVCVCMIKKEV